MNFCLNCATALAVEVRCPQCSGLMPAKSNFCGQCGARLGAENSRAVVAQDPVAPIPTVSDLIAPGGGLGVKPTTVVAPKPNGPKAGTTGERREVTVLFADVANFTSTTNAIESEEAFLFIDEMMRLLVEVVYRYEGTVDKFTGDGMMALFGAPITNENDPERAVRAALEMQEVIRPAQERLVQSHGFELKLRIGINTGMVIAGSLGSDLHMEYTVIGDTVNLASRLESAARPGTVLVSYATYQRTRPLFHYKIMPPVIAKGFPDPVRANQPLGLRKQPGQLRGLPGLQVPMIGRQAPAQRLQKALRDMVENRHTTVALVTADAGVGKSRLVMEFQRTFPEEGVNHYQGGCLTYARSRPMWVVSEVLRDLLGLSEAETEDRQNERVHAYLRQLGLVDEDVLPYVLHTLGLSQQDNQVLVRLNMMDAGVLQTQTYAALRRVFVKEAMYNPTVLVFEDLHWVDPASRSFLEHLLQTVDDVPLMLVLVSRQMERESVVASLVELAYQRPDRLVDVELTPFNRAEAEQFLDHLITEHNPATLALKETIIQRSGGIPFYTEELVRMLMEQDGLVREGDEWQVTPKAKQLLVEVPGTVKGLILTRFDKLSPELRVALQRSAVCGQSFPEGLIQSLNGYTPSQISTQLVALVERQFLVEAPFGGEPGYSFRHDLILGTIYGTLLHRDRRYIHERVARTIENTSYWTPDEKVEVLAYHYSESTDASQAIPFLIMAAENATRRYAHEITIKHYRDALALLRDELSTEDSRFILIWEGLGRALKFTGEFAEAGALLEQAVQHLQDSNWSQEFRLEQLVSSLRELADLCIREGSLEQAVVHLQDALATLGMDDRVRHPNLLQSLMDRLAWVRFRQGKLDEAFVLAEDAIGQFGSVKSHEVEPDPSAQDQGSNPITLASLYNTLGGISWQRGLWADATRYVERSLELRKEVNYTWGMAIANTNLGVLYYSQGIWPKAKTHFELADRLHLEYGYLPEQPLNLANLGQLLAAMGEHASARQNYERSLVMSSRMGDEFAILLAELGLASLWVLAGEFSQASVHLVTAQGHLDAAGTDQIIQYHWLHALVLNEQGEQEEAIQQAELGLSLATQTGLVGGQADSGRVLAILLFGQNRQTEAEEILQTTIALCQQNDDPYRQGQALTILGNLYAQMGQEVNAYKGRTTGYLHQAQVAYLGAIDLFTDLGAQFDLAQARTAYGQVVQVAQSQISAS